MNFWHLNVKTMGGEELITHLSEYICPDLSKKQKHAKANDKFRTCKDVLIN